MSDRPTKLVVDLSYPEGHELRQQVIELTDEEIAEREELSIQVAEEQAAREAEAVAKAEALASAQAKLSALGLTEKEISALLD